MNEQNFSRDVQLPSGKFRDPDITAKGEVRASVELASLTRRWTCRRRKSALPAVNRS